MGNQAIKKRDYANAERYLLEAADMAKDKEMKENVYYTLAVLASQQRAYPKKRTYCYKAL